MTPTDAERAALAFLGDEECSSSALAGLYEQRWREKLSAEGLNWPVTSARRGAWNRTSGSVMRRLADRGFLVISGWGRYNPRYRRTDAGREAAAGG